MATKIEIKREFRSSHQSRQVLLVVCFCSFAIFLLMSWCLISSYWITAEGFRQGLMFLCIEETNSHSRSQYEPLPFDLSREELEPGCHPNRDVAYIRISTILCMVTILSAITSTILSGLGASRFKGSKRATCLRFTICTTLVILFCDICLLIIYPTQFAKEIDKSNRDLWELNYGFGLACGSAILAFGSLILLVTAFVSNSSIYESAPTRI